MGHVTRLVVPSSPSGGPLTYGHRGEKYLTERKSSKQPLFPRQMTSEDSAPLFSIAFRRSTVWILWSTLTNAEDPQLSIVTFLCVWHGVAVSIRMSVAVSVLDRKLLYLTFTCNVKGSNCLLILHKFFMSQLV